jgi:hypothetical protein
VGLLIISSHEIKKKMIFFSADMDHGKAVAKAIKAGDTIPTNFKGSASKILKSVPPLDICNYYFTNILK